MTLEDIKVQVDSLTEKIQAPIQFLPTYGQSKDGAHPHIEINASGQLYYVVVERGEELRRDFATDLDDLLYRIFADVTFQMALQFELAHRNNNEDCRRKMFAKQEELLGILSEKWKEREQKEHQSILSRNPYDDHSSIRADYSLELTQKGIEAAQAWEEACRKYPLPKSS